VNDTDLDIILAATRPPTDAELAPVDLDAAFAALLEDIGTATPIEHARPRRNRLRFRLAIAGGLALIAVTAVALIGSFRSGDDLSAYAAEAVEVAEANRRLLITDEAWHVDYVAWESSESGDVQFIDGPNLESATGMLEITWYPDSEKGRYIDYSDRERIAPVEIAGQDVFVQFEKQKYREPGSVGFDTTLPAIDGTITVIDGTIAGDEEDVIELLESIEPVDTASWLEAMPDNAVQASDQAGEIDQLLEGVPLPEGFDRSVLELAALPQDEYQLTAHVMYGVYCGWLDEWWAADQAGDTKRANAAIEELESSPQWPAVVAQKETGALDQDFRMYAQTVAAGDADPKVYDQMMNCIAY
jgi:hypothetical protein